MNWNTDDFNAHAFHVFKILSSKKVAAYRKSVPWFKPVGKVDTLVKRHGNFYTRNSFFRKCTKAADE